MSSIVYPSITHVLPLVFPVSVVCQRQDHTGLARWQLRLLLLAPRSLRERWYVSLRIDQRMLFRIAFRFPLLTSFAFGTEAVTACDDRLSRVGFCQFQMLGSDLVSRMVVFQWLSSAELCSAK